MEAEFYRFHTRRNSRLETQFHYARGLTWAVVLLRTVLAKEWQASVVIAVGTVTTLLPAFAPRLLGRQYLSWRLMIEVFDNLLQVALGCYTHHHIYPNPKTGGPSIFQMATVLVTGNGVAWLLFCSLWGSLPFRHALPQQAAMTIILLVYNRILCRTSMPIQFAYATLARQLRKLHPASLLRSYCLFQNWAEVLNAGRSCAAAVLAAPAGAREAVRQACMRAAAAGAGTGLHTLAAQPLPDSLAANSAVGEQLCLKYQPLSLLALGFVLPTLYIWWAELRLRCAFLAWHRSQAEAGAGAGLSASTSSAATTTTTTTTSGPHSLHGWERRLWRLPTLSEYFAFCIPAVCAMYTFVVVQS